ncbi:phage tail protein [Bartonella queenslandensis]|uniref:phage tail protein n=1 Tax=Bartonella queenslandensis TaxID=481138 RepID=UPI00031E2509|nr:phage tail protein [Bartonella queenslandensis]
MSDIYRWSLRAAENSVADSLINWSEGQSPHTVNNSARGMMQRIREYLSDTSGGLESIVDVNFELQLTKIKIETKSQFLEYKSGLVVSFRAKGGNIGITTVALNDLLHKPVYKASETGVCLLGGGEIQYGCIYTLVYDEEISGWQLLNPTLKKVPHFKRVPIGFVGAFAMQALPSGWLLCDGGAYSRSVYSDLFAAIGTMWGSGDGSTTFNVPDLRGMFLRGFDYLGVIDQGRGFATTQSYSMIDHEHFIDLLDESRVSSRTRRELSRNKRSVIVDYWSHGIYSNKDEECAGLTGNALEACSSAFEDLSQITQEVPFEKESTPKPHILHPFFIRYGGRDVSFYAPIIPGQEIPKVHDHTIMTGLYGGVETRPMNTSVVYGIKT